MDKKVFLICTVFCILSRLADVLTQEVGAIKIDLAISPIGVVLPNTTVTFTCRLTGFLHTTIVNFNKGVPVDPIKAPIRERISQGTELLDIYRRRKDRYTIEHDTEGNDILYIMTISALQYEDSGLYSCSANHQEHGIRFSAVSLEVYRKPETVFFNRNETIITVNEGEELPLICTSTQSMPIPRVEMWITSGEYVEHHQSMDLSVERQLISDIINRLRNNVTEHWRDVTDKFLVSSEVKPYCKELAGDDNKNCPLHFDYEMTAVNRDFKPEVRHDGQNITCLVTMREYDQASVTASITLRVHYTPKILCANIRNGESLVHVNTTHHSIVCKVWANPPFNETEDDEDPSIQWSDKPCDWEKFKRLPEDGEDYTLKEDSVSHDRKNRTIALFFKKAITKDHFKNRYCLRLRNSAGLTKQEFTLRDFNELQRPPNAGSTVTSHSMTVLATALFFFAKTIDNFF